MATTARFGFEKFGGVSGGAITDNGGKFSSIDRDTLDLLLYAFERHDHGAAPDAVPLADPSDAPTGTMAVTGGTLPGDATYYYSVSYIDEFGLETAASDELTLSTDAAPNVTAAPVTNGDSTAGNTLPNATYYYALTALSDQGQSALGPQSIITTQPGQTGVLLTLPAMDNGITGYNVWRHGMSDAGWTKVGVEVTDTTWLDTGVPTGDCLTDPATQPPSTVTAVVTGTNAATITVPDPALVATIGGPVKAWRLYRSDSSGNFGPESLLVEVVPVDDATPMDTSYTDTGGTALAGQPSTYSTTLTPSRRLWGAGDTLPAVTGLPENYLFINRAEKTLYALIGGAWAKLGGSGGGGGGGTSGGFNAYTTNDSSFTLADSASSISLPSGQWVSLIAADTGANVQNVGADLLSDGGDPINYLHPQTAGLYSASLTVIITGLDPGDVVDLSVSGFGAPYTLTSQFITPAFQENSDGHYFTVTGTATAPPGAYLWGAVHVAKPAGASAPAATVASFNLVLGYAVGTRADDTDKTPHAPGNLTATRTGSTLALSWLPAIGGDGPVKDYTVEVADESGYSSVSYVSTTTATINGVPTGDDLDVAVRARNRWGTGSAATATVALPPVALPYVDSFGYTDGVLPAPWKPITDPAPTVADDHAAGPGAALIKVGQADMDVTATFIDDGTDTAATNWLVAGADKTLWQGNVRVSFNATGGYFELAQASVNGNDYGIALTGGARSFTGFAGGQTTLRLVLSGGTSVTVYQNGASLGTATLPHAAAGTYAGFSIGQGMRVDDLAIA